MDALPYTEYANRHHRTHTPHAMLQVHLTHACHAYVSAWMQASVVRLGGVPMTSMVARVQVLAEEEEDAASCCGQEVVALEGTLMKVQVIESTYH